MKQQVCAQLTQQIFPFWHALRDETVGGFYGAVSYDLEVEQSAEKGCILNSRILWFFSKAAVLFAEEGTTQGDVLAQAALSDAKHAYEFLTKKCIDPQHGGVYWSLNADDSVQDTTKHTYNQGFAIYALSAYYSATRDQQALDLAHKIYHLIKHSISKQRRIFGRLCKKK